MVERRDVEALLEIVRGGTEQVCDRLGVAPGHTVYAVEVDTLAALCRAWLAVDGAPVRMVGSTYNLSVSVAGTGISNGQRVRIVKEPVE